MRGVCSGVQRLAALFVVVALLLIPVAGIADDSQLRPPQPQSVVQPADDSQVRPPWPQSVPAQPSLWHTLLVVIANAGFLTLVD